MHDDIIEIPVSEETKQTSPQDESFAEKLRSDLSEHSERLAGLLRPSDPRGVIDDSSISVDDLTTNPDGSGIVYLSYDETADYGCKDVSKDLDGYDDFGFTYDASRSVIRFVVPPPPERAPDEF